MMGFIIVIAGFLLICAVIFFGWGFVKRGHLMQLLNGLQIEATIIDHIPDRNIDYYAESQAPLSYEIRYRYEYDGKIFENRVPVSKYRHHLWSKGDTVFVFCLPYEPKKSILVVDRTYEKQLRAKARRLFALGTFSVLLLVLEIYLVVVFTK